MSEALGSNLWTSGFIPGSRAEKRGAYGGRRQWESRRARPGRGDSPQPSDPTPRQACCSMLADIRRGRSRSRSASGGVRRDTCNRVQIDVEIPLPPAKSGPPAIDSRLRCSPPVPRRTDRATHIQLLAAIRAHGRVERWPGTRGVRERFFWRQSSACVVAAHVVEAEISEMPADRA